MCGTNLGSGPTAFAGGGQKSGFAPLRAAWRFQRRFGFQGAAGGIVQPAEQPPDLNLWVVNWAETLGNE